MRLKGRVALVTAGAGGIGKAICMDLARDGATVVCSDINLEQAKKVVAALTAAGYQGLALAADITSQEQLGRLVKTTLEKLGTVDILVNVGGGSAKWLTQSEPWGVKEEVFFWQSTERIRSHVVDVNLKGIFCCCRAVLDHMIQKRSGKIVNIASVAAIFGNPKQADYVAAKAGVIMFTKSLAKEVGQYGVYVNCVSPGTIQTQSHPSLGERYDESLKRTPLGRFGKPEEVASVVTFLASDDASFVTGQNIAVCGGKT